MKADGKNRFIKIGYNQDVVAEVVKCYNQWRTQPKEIVADLVGLPIYEQCYCIFRHIIDNVQYREDEIGAQYIKSPARLMTDGVGDCKSMALFVNSCLYCLGIRHVFRFVNFDGGQQYTHVYTVAFDENNEMIIIDCVERDKNGQPIFNYARDFKRNKDIYVGL